VGLVYQVEDRSVLLPLYKRALVQPALRLIPARLHPNAITHAGHVCNLLGTAVLLLTWPRSGWPYAAAALGVNLYNWCDNADGAHARRTGQTSAGGELLDHGLDMLNTTYIAYLGAIGVGAPPLWWIAIALVLPAAAGATYWEQAETGTFHLGRVNQIESVLAETAVLATSAVFGVEAFERVRVGGITLRLAVIVLVTSIASAGVVHGMWRVARAKGSARVLPVLPLLAFCAVVELAAFRGAISFVAAAVIAAAGTVFFGLRMLAVRAAGEAPRVEGPLVVVTALLAGLVGWRAMGEPVGEVTDVAFAGGAAVVLVGLAVANARKAGRAVGRIDRAAAGGDSQTISSSYPIR
jgi:phosphatidylglycerophosphate synthase